MEIPPPVTPCIKHKELIKDWNGKCYFHVLVIEASNPGGENLPDNDPYNASINIVNKFKLRSSVLLLHRCHTVCVS